MLTDDDLPLRIEATAALGYWSLPATPTLIGRVKALSNDDCVKFARALAGDPSTDGPSVDQNGIRKANEAIELLRSNADGEVSAKVQRILDDRTLAHHSANAAALTRPLGSTEQAALDSFRQPGTRGQRLAAIKQIRDAKNPATIPAFIGLLSDPEPDVRLEAARCLISQNVFAINDTALVGVVKILVADPVMDTRSGAAYSWMAEFHRSSDFGMPGARIADIVERGNDDLRWSLASLLGIEQNGASPFAAETRDKFLKPLLKLTSDPTPKVHIAAAHSAALWLESPNPAPAELLRNVTESLQGSDLKVRDAGLDAIYRLPPETVQAMAGSKDPLLRARC